MAAESPRSASRRLAAEAKNGAGLLSPRFRSVAELAGWDEESILLASLVVEDTPVRESRRKRRPSSAGGSAGSNTRKRRSWRQSPGGIPAPIPIPPVMLVLDDDEDDGHKPNNPADDKKEEIKDKKEEIKEEQSKVSAVEEKEASGSAKELPCMDRLREELSCAICLDICFEPSTTPCGHSFCMQCLKRAASKCGKRCPKCRQLISNSRSCTINTVLWNTIQLLFPSEVEARRTSIASCSATMDDVKQSVPRSNSIAQGGMRTRNTSTSSIVQDSTRISNTSRSLVTPGSRRSVQGPGSMNTSSGSFDTQGRSTRSRHSSRSFVQASQLVPARGSSESDDSALAYRLQQEEFMTAFHTEDEERQPQNAVSTARASLRAMASWAVRLRTEDEESQPQNAVSTARANLRAMASRAVRLRARGWPL
uniref:Uncharacterized protein n=1 Tax=Avena sativa TaxID=4498 RepID=A0ACD5VNS9_AVESA